MIGHRQAILATQFNSFEKGPEFADELRGLLGTGVFNADGTVPSYSTLTDVFTRFYIQAKYGSSIAR
ncbi:hypothetical protein PISMIDRAFT_686264 [Pisolithus microcarpus 441]|uniref:Uncharacterized protein n=1 Tax=Pisolithus microcarpus 441 TaxID=765257 RepID=A0A0C9YRM1_9AGAM|nr:hypothetical protein PISMIDRAFT_686264 [Pisolithus microcarpus 441]